MNDHTCKFPVVDTILSIEDLVERHQQKAAGSREATHRSVPGDGALDLSGSSVEQFVYETEIRQDQSALKCRLPCYSILQLFWELGG
jgi:hypothetical protein